MEESVTSVTALVSAPKALLFVQLASKKEMAVRSASLAGGLHCWTAKHAALGDSVPNKVCILL
jgi:hypothetical protein